MAYMLSLISIILVLFLFIDEHELESKEKIFGKSEEQEIRKYELRKKYIKENIEIIEFAKIEKLSENVLRKKEYILLYKEGVNISGELLQKLLYNYIYRKEILSVYNGRYIFDADKNISKFKKIKQYVYANLLNYVNIFDKQSMNSYMTILGRPEEILNYTRDKKIICYLTDNIVAEMNLDNDSQKHKAFELYVDSVKNLNIFTSLKIGLFIFSTGSVTLNLIRSGFNIATDIYAFILSFAIYYCYVQIVGYMYKPIGKIKYVATYLFPLYIVIYIFVIVYIGIQNIKKT